MSLFPSTRMAGRQAAGGWAGRLPGPPRVPSAELAALWSPRAPRALAGSITTEASWSRVAAIWCLPLPRGPGLPAAELQPPRRMLGR